MKQSFTIAKLAEIVGGTLRGDGSAVIDGVAEVSAAQPNQATWVTRGQYAKKLPASRAGVVLVAPDFGATPMPAILCARLDRAVALLLGAFARPPDHPALGVHPTAVIDPTARIGPNAAIGPHVVIGPGVRVGASCVLCAGVFLGREATIGDDCVLWPNVVVRDGCTLGNRVIVHPNAVIGADGFGYYRDAGHYQKVPHTGGVVLEDDVEIGACACIDRAKFADTVIGRGTKIDNLVQIGHNARVGTDCVLAGQSGVSGSVRIGHGCVIGGQVGIIDNLVIGDGASFGACAVVTRDVEAGQAVAGWPIQEISRALRTQALMIRLPELAAELKELAARVERLEASADHRS